MSSSANVPQHVGIIMDGNRRWARQHGLPVYEGHKRGYEVFRTIADAAIERGIKFLTVYAFSTENWERTDEEVSFLMKFSMQILKREMKNLHERNIRFIWLGSENRLEKKIVQSLRDAEKLTRNNTKGTFCYCFNYGGRAEIVEAARKLAADGKDITQESISKSLYAPEVPDIDLLIRTSGEKRLSNFMLWRAAYSELFFADEYWPDFTIQIFDNMLAEYAERQRRFGC